MGICSNPMRGSQVEEVGVGALNGERLQKIDCSKIAGETEMKQMHREESIVEGKMKGKKRENKLIAAQEIMGSIGRVENIEERNNREHALGPLPNEELSSFDLCQKCLKQLDQFLIAHISVDIDYDMQRNELESTNIGLFL
ncbi:hypothetical protein WN944_026338 [Citrus x changshan-huyou]|uniref:Uncharacterized protein n=1 Tax=Citrus x changshan-huyou TaxID=2935761 RepID=A0AAP0LRG4_9ROSI